MKGETALLLAIVVFFILFVLTLYLLTNGFIQSTGIQAIQTQLFFLFK